MIRSATPAPRTSAQATARRLGRTAPRHVAPQGSRPCAALNDLHQPRASRSAHPPSSPSGGGASRSKAEGAQSLRFLHRLPRTRDAHPQPPDKDEAGSFLSSLHSPRVRVPPQPQALIEAHRGHRAHPHPRPRTPRPHVPARTQTLDPAPPPPTPRPAIPPPAPYRPVHRRILLRRSPPRRSNSTANTTPKPKTTTPSATSGSARRTSKSSASP